MRRLTLLVLLPLLALSTSGFSCGGGGGGGGGGATAGGGGAAAGGALDALIGWVRGWSAVASRGTRRPPNFDIPPPPAIELPATAARPVPGSTEFFSQFMESAMEVQFQGPPEQELEDAVELFRNAIEKGQNLVEDLRYGAIAAACTAPLGG